MKMNHSKESSCGFHFSTSDKMDIETALDRDTRISVAEAQYEIEDHNCESYVMGDVLWGNSDGGEIFEQVCIVFKGQVKSRQVMLWLGY